MFLDHDALWGPGPVYGPPAIQLSDRWDLYALVDEIDLEWARRWKWSHTHGSGQRIVELSELFGKHAYQRSHDKIYAKRSHGRSGTMYLHVEIARRAFGPRPEPGMVVDHLNGNSLDCRRENLRWATLSQNNKNLFGSAWLQTRMDL